MKRLLYLIPILFLIHSCKVQSLNIQNIQVNEAKKLITDGIQILDVRTQEEISQGKIDHAIEIDWYANDFKEQVAKLEKEKPILVYCKVGGRSSRASKTLVELGFTKVYNLVGGYQAWNGAK